MSTRATKAWLIAGLWVVQFAAFYAAPAVFMGVHEDLGSAVKDLASTDYALFGVLLATFMSGVQGAFLLPIRAPEPKRDASPSLLRLFAIAVCMSVVLGGVGAYVLVGLNAADLIHFDEKEMEQAFWIVALVLTVPLFMFLLWRFKDGLPVLVSILMAALMAGVVLAGIVMGGAGLVRLITNVDTPPLVWTWLLLPASLAGWAVFTPVIFAFVKKGAPEAQLSKLAARLLIGTTIEAVAVIPVEVMVRKKTTCYCDEASFWSLVASLSVGLVTLGPAILLLGWKRYHLRVVEGKCRACGYDMSATPKAERCPECGAGWKEEGMG